MTHVPNPGDDDPGDVPRADPSDVPVEDAPATLSEDEHLRLVGLVSTVAQHGPQPLLRLWDDLVATYGVEATSRLWQEALSSGDASQT